PRTPREQACDVHRDEHQDSDEQDTETTDSLCQPTKEHRAHELAEITEGNDHSNFRRRQFPFAHQNWHRVGDRQDRVSVEKGCSADNVAQPEDLARDGKSLQTSAYFGLRLESAWCTEKRGSLHQHVILRFNLIFFLLSGYPHTFMHDTAGLAA